MSWIGKIVGGTIGFALGGPLGAIAGGVFGHAFDISEDRRLSRPQVTAGLSSAEQAQMVFFMATFSMLAKLAGADGEISPEETGTIDRFMDQDLRLTPGNKQIAFKIFQQAARSDSHFNDFARQFYDQFQDRPEMVTLLLDILLRVSLADGILSPEEDRLLLNAADIFGYSQTAFEQLKDQYRPNTDKYYAVLNCNPDDSDEAIKKQYRRLVQEYHPDKIAAKGLPEEFTRFAADKFREIQEAYNQIKEARQGSI